MLVTLSRIPRWLISALGLQDPELPTELGETTVSPTLDVFQGGWGEATFVRERTEVAPGTAANNNLRVLPARTDVTRVIFALSIENNTAGAHDFILKLFNEVLAITTQLSLETVAGGGVARTEDFLSGLWPYIVPPGRGLALAVPATGVGENIVIALEVGEFFAGFKPV